MNLKWNEVRIGGAQTGRWELVVDDPDSEDDGVLMATVQPKRRGEYRIIYWNTADDENGKEIVFKGSVPRAKDSMPAGGRVQVCKVRPYVGRWHAHFNGFRTRPARSIGVFNTIEQAKAMCVIEVRFSEGESK
jgi:hypothetical protein